MATYEQALEIVTKLALFYATELDEQIQMPLYAKTLEPYSVDLLNEALNRYCQNTANDKFPIPPSKIILEITGRPQDDDAAANEVAARIQQCMTKFGCGVYLDEVQRVDLNAKVRAFIGEVGWAVIELEGGWTTFCTRANESDQRIARAQTRDLAKSVLRSARNGTLGQAPALPQPINQKLLGQQIPQSANGPSAVGDLLNNQKNNQEKSHAINQTTNQELPLDLGSGAQTRQGESDRREKQPREK